MVDVQPFVTVEESGGITGEELLSAVKHLTPNTSPDLLENQDYKWYRLRIKTPVGDAIERVSKRSAKLKARAYAREQNPMSTYVPETHIVDEVSGDWIVFVLIQVS